MQKIKKQAKLANLADFLKTAEDFFKEQSISDDRISELLMALEELLVNIIQYAYPDSNGCIELCCQNEKNSFLEIKIIDSGLPFNPELSPQPDLNKPLAERANGGMGIYLAEKIVDEMNYKREKNKNILILRIRKSGKK